ncbi:hypothetical protein WJX72_009506 [[Myrmecia] bisecta]|uniref:Methyltransferase domain-containing protein n=1 Tax=[Myrmecia] bisecta TaxID=41462 RepID=A0AAW1Q0Z9_9CHLO
MQAGRLNTCLDYPADKMQAADLRSGNLQVDVKPGIADSSRFKSHWSVEFWRDFTTDPDKLAAGHPGASRTQAVLQEVVNAVQQAGVFSSTSAAAYWAYHVSRSSFFALQGLASLAATRAAFARKGLDNSSTSVAKNPSLEGTARMLAETMAMYNQDLVHIQEGLYKLPWDMTTLTHRQYNPLFVARRGLQFLAEAANTLSRRLEGKPEPVWLDSAMYPEYYLNTWHYQTDGWLSERSAKIYEVSTETLFLGRQDAMQRQTLVPISQYMREVGSPEGQNVKLLEVACGTGRFATFLKDNWPQMELTALDLSPYYLQEARNNMRHWHTRRAADLQMGGLEGTGARFLQAPAENIPDPNNTYDVVTCIYLFHELPPDVRRKVVKEMARVVKPGGLVVLTDAYQLGDRPANDAFIGAFGDFNEPYFRDYVATDLGALFEEAGLKCDQKLMAASSKVLSFRKPMQAASNSPDQITTMYG